MAAIAVAFRRADALVAKFPVSWAVFSAGLKGGLGDAIAQKVIEGKRQMDVRRSIVYTSFSGVYLGGIQYFVQCRILENWFPGRSAVRVAQKVAFDQFIHLPLIAFPCLYIVKEYFMPTLLPGEQEPTKLVTRSLTKYRSEARDVNVSLWKFWVPASTIGFAFIPTHWRIPYNSALSLAWTVILSNLQANLDAKARTR